MFFLIQSDCLMINLLSPMEIINKSGFFSFLGVSLKIKKKTKLLRLINDRVTFLSKTRSITLWNSHFPIAIFFRTLS